jgi:hypothetical protein
MKNLTLILIGIISFVTACSQKRVLIEELTKAGGLFYSNSKPFTGVAFSVKRGYGVAYNPNQISQEIEFKNGKEDGKTIMYHRNGKISYLTTFKEGIKNGIYESYDESGDILNKGNFKNGKAEGEWIIWLNGGESSSPPVFVKTTYKEGKRFGTSIYYTNFFKTKNIKENYVITRATYDNGKLIDGDVEEDILDPDRWLMRINFEKSEIENHIKIMEEYKKEDSLFKIIEKMPKRNLVTAGGEILSEGDFEPLPQRKFSKPPISLELFKKQLKEHEFLRRDSTVYNPN